MLGWVTSMERWVDSKFMKDQQEGEDLRVNEPWKLNFAQSQLAVHKLDSIKDHILPSSTTGFMVA